MLAEDFLDGPRRALARRAAGAAPRGRAGGGRPLLRPPAAAGPDGHPAGRAGPPRPASGDRSSTTSPASSPTTARERPRLGRPARSSRRASTSTAAASSSSSPTSACPTSRPAPTTSCAARSRALEAHEQPGPSDRRAGAERHGRLTAEVTRRYRDGDADVERRCSAEARPRRDACRSSPRSSAPGSSRAATAGRVVALDRRRRRSLLALGDARRRRCSRARRTSRCRPSACSRPGSTSTASCSRWRRASHSGEAFHLDGVRRILAAAGLDETALQTPPDLPVDEAATLRLVARRRRRRTALRHELLGQARRHAGHLRRQRLADSTPTATRTTRCSGRCSATVERLPASRSPPTGVDGCGAPLFALTLAGLARAFVALARRRAGHAGAAGWPTRCAPSRVASAAPAAT